jgi:hypothetical protein
MVDMFQCVCVADQEQVRQSIATNLGRSLPSVPYGTINGGPISICGNGPSLREVYPDGKSPRQPIVALNGAWKSLYDNGIIPDYVVAYDPHPRNAEWFVDAPKEPIYLIGSRAHPDCFDLLENHDVKIWHCDGPIERDNFGLSDLVFGGPSVGLHSINLLAALGYRHFDLYGYDSCYAVDGADHASPQDWGPDEAPRVFTVGDKSFLCSPWMVAQAQEFLKLAEDNRKTYSVHVRSPGMLRELCIFAWGHPHNNRTLEAVYDLGVAPGSFDFIWSLMNIENFRRSKGYRAAKVHFKAGPNEGFRPNEPIDVGHAHKSGMMNNVVRPLLKFFDFEETERLRESEFLTCTYSPRPTVDLYREDGIIPTFAPSKNAMAWAAPYKGCVTITLREAHYWPQRNSDVEEWMDAAITLAHRGELVVVLRDTAKAREPLRLSLLTCPEASVDLDRRLALYSVAKTNLGVVNGPLGLCWATTTIPYLTMWTDAPGYACYNDEWLKGYIGFGLGEQFPWADPRKQRIVWKNDTRKNILDAYDSMFERAELAA